jgi:hypothetical protein
MVVSLRVFCLMLRVFACFMFCRWAGCVVTGVGQVSLFRLFQHTLQHANRIRYLQEVAFSGPKSDMAFGKRASSSGCNLIKAMNAFCGYGCGTFTGESRPSMTTTLPGLLSPRSPQVSGKISHDARNGLDFCNQDAFIEVWTLKGTTRRCRCQMVL